MTAARRVRRSLAARLDDCEAARVRAVREASRHRQHWRKLYDRNRRLENAVRIHARRECSCASPAECLERLARRIPSEPRETLLELDRRLYAVQARFRRTG